MATSGSHENRGFGAVLRAARTERGLSLADLQARTKIRAKYLAALEDERVEDLPPYPFARGFVHTVALELGLDPAPLVRRLAAVMDARAASAGIRRLDIEPAVTPTRAQRLKRTALIGLIVVGVPLAAYFVRQLYEFSRPDLPAVSQPVGAAPPVAPSPQAPPVGSQVPGLAEAPAAAPEQRATPLLPLAGRVAVEVELTGVSWLLVVADGRTVFQGLLAAGEVRRWEGADAVRLRIGNAAAVRLVVNGRSLGTLGGPGEVVDRTFESGVAP